jgi:hypothetical protein
MYKLLSFNNVNSGVIRLSDSASIPFDEANTDYQAYLEWVAKGNQPEEAE